MNQNDFYNALGVNPGAENEAIKAAFRQKAKEHHPDTGGDAEQFRTVCHAYKMLTDPSYRYKDEQKNQPIQVQVQISLEQAIFGCTITNYIRKQTVRATEEGKTELSGKADSTVIQIVDKLPPRMMRFPFIVKHPNMDLGGGQRQDVEIFYGLGEHKYYKLDPKSGALMVTIEVELFTALKGGKVEVETLFGLRTLRIPAGTEPDDVLILKNHGDLGNLLVKIEIIYPKKDELKADRKKWKDVVETDWEREQRLDLEEQNQIHTMFINLGGTPKF